MEAVGHRDQAPVQMAAERVADPEGGLAAAVAVALAALEVLADSVEAVVLEEAPEELVA